MLCIRPRKFAKSFHKWLFSCFFFFFASIGMILQFLSFFLLMWWITLTSFQMLNHCCFWNKNHLIMVCYSLYVLLDSMCNIFCWGFLHTYSWGMLICNFFLMSLWCVGFTVIFTTRVGRHSHFFCFWIAMDPSSTYSNYQLCWSYFIFNSIHFLLLLPSLFWNWWKYFFKYHRRNNFFKVLNLFVK